MFCKLLQDAYSWVEVNTKHLRNGPTQQQCFSLEWHQLQDARGDGEQQTVMESRAVFKSALGLM